MMLSLAILIHIQKSRQRVVPLPFLWYDGVGDKDGRTITEKKTNKAEEF